MKGGEVEHIEGESLPGPSLGDLCLVSCRSSACHHRRILVHEGLCVACHASSPAVLRVGLVAAGRMVVDRFGICWHLLRARPLRGMGRQGDNQDATREFDAGWQRRQARSQGLATNTHSMPPYSTDFFVECGVFSYLL